MSRTTSLALAGFILILIAGVYTMTANISNPGSTVDTPYRTQELPSGVRLIHEHRNQPPIISIKVFLTAGSARESESEHGLAKLTADVLTHRTEGRDMFEFNQFIENHGLKISSTVHPDYTELSFTGISDRKTELLELVSAVLTGSSFDTETVQHLKQQQLAALARRRDNAFQYAFDQALKGFYGDHPYNHPAVGRTETVRGFTAEDCRAFYREYYDESTLVVSSVGDLTQSDITGVLKPVDLPGTSGDSPDPPSPEPSTHRIVRERPVDQPSHVLYFAGPEISADTYVDVKVLDAVLGGGMGSLLFREMREKRSLGYQVGSAFPSRRMTSTFRVYLGGGSSEGSEFRRAFDELVGRLIEEGPTPDELTKARQYVRGNFLLDHETPGQTAWYRGFYEVLGRGVEYDDQYPRAVKSVTAQDVRNVAKQVLRGSEPVFVTVKPE